MEITLASGRKIGDGHAPYIIGEVGSNWQTLEDCLLSIRQAKGAGADAVKFQAYDYEALYGMACPRLPVSFADGRPSPNADLPGQLPLEWLPKLKAECDKVGIDFMCSAFSPELLKAVDPYVSAHKIASAELSHVRLLEAARECGKPVFLSTGASGLQDIRNALEVLRAPESPLGFSKSGCPVILMYCVAAYPAREIHLDGIHWLKRNFGTLIGYSDHSLDAYILPKAAAKTGACVIEKHVTFIDAETPDSPHSLNERQFKGMVNMIRSSFPFQPGPTPEERPMILRHTRRLIATRDIKPGETFQEGVNFGIYRSLKDDSKALSPWAINQVNGRVAKGPIAAGDGIGPGDIE